MILRWCIVSSLAFLLCGGSTPARTMRRNPIPSRQGVVLLRTLTTSNNEEIRSVGFSPRRGTRGRRR